MTKAELVEEVARAAELTKKDSEVIVEEVFKNIIQALNRGEKIELRGFGSFRVRQRDARRGRNPKTGAPVDIPAKRVPYFKPGKELKELINAQGDGDGDGFEAGVFDDDEDEIQEAESLTAEAGAES
jgi:integration host factor subunit beta